MFDWAIERLVVAKGELRPRGFRSLGSRPELVSGGQRPPLH
jgi:hypothetical protein